MLLRTHLMLALTTIILFFNHVDNRILFIGLVFFGTILPDLDSNVSEWGKHFIFRPLQFFVKHRGIIHSLTAGVIFSVILSIFFPIASLGFFLGYSVHLVSDSFTREGIQPFWPLKAKSYGFIATGGKIEESLFFSLILINLVLFFLVFLL